MDMERYKEEFVSDARDHLDNLNEQLLILEKEPENEETINALFRAFHTLKGNAGMMGYNRFSELAHSLEDLLHRVRDKELALSKDVVELLFEGCDTLDRGIQLIEKGAPEELEAEHLVEEVSHLLESHEEAATEVDVSGPAPLTDAERKRIAAWQKKGYEVLRVVVVFDPKHPLRVAKASLLLRDLAADGTIIRADPPVEEIRAGRFGNEFSLILATKQSRKELEEGIGLVVGVRHVDLLDPEASFERPEVVNAEQKEHAKQAITQKHQNQVSREIRSVKVDMYKLDKLMNLVGELLINNIRLQGVTKDADVNSLRTVSQGIDRLILELQDQVMKIRMVPIGTICKRYPRLVRDLAAKEGKEVDLIIEGAETEFDRTVLDQIGEPLVHLLRNSVDHGIESMGERTGAGKESRGVIRLSVYRERSHAVIKLADDGRGIDTALVKEHALRKKVVSDAEASRMSDEELRNLVFRPGMSTSTAVTEVSGRGVGMDVVLSRVRDLGGNLRLSSDPGVGTEVTIRLPLTLAILSALLVRAADELFAIPLSSVERIVDIAPEAIKTVQGHETFIHRNQDVPLFRLARLVGLEENACQTHTVVIVNRGGKDVGLIVEGIESQQQVLIKGLQSLVKGTKGAAGVTILADGNVVLVLDLETLF